MPKVKNIIAREVIDSRGNPTVEVEIHSDNGTIASAIVPSGASTGEHEALELRDADQSRYNGRGVLKACSNVNDVIAKSAVDFELGDQVGFDKFLLELDGTPNKAKLGANAILGCSMAYARLSAQSQQKWLYEYLSQSDEYTLPTPMMNVINGGQHADSGLDIQEFMIMPTGIEKFSEKLRAGVEIFHALKKLLSDNGYTISVGDEGGFAPQLETNEQALDFLMQAIEKAGYKAGSQIQIALDVASSEFFSNGTYNLKINGEQVSLTSTQMTDYYAQLIQKYPIFSIEDGHDQNDWDGWKEITARLGDKVQLVGDDFLVTNTERIEKAISIKGANSVLIKLNQIGTVTETINAIEMAKSAGWTSVVSHRSGETEDTFIADLAVGLATGQIKTGSLSRTDRIAKYNQLLRIEQNLGL
jgi:enolase